MKPIRVWKQIVIPGQLDLTHLFIVSIAVFTVKCMRMITNLLLINICSLYTSTSNWRNNMDIRSIFKYSLIHFLSWFIIFFFIAFFENFIEYNFNSRVLCNKNLDQMIMKLHELESLENTFVAYRIFYKFFKIL